MRYIKNRNVYTCPDDGVKPQGVDDTNTVNFARSYVASAAAESLSLAQIDFPTNVIVIVDKWHHVDNGIGATGTKVNTETWLEPYDGDECQMGSDANAGGGCIDLQAGYPRGMVKMANWHQGGMNNTMYDGHAKWLQPTTIWGSADLTGCSLVHQYPSRQPGSVVCDQSIPGCAASVTRNICNLFYH